MTDVLLQLSDITYAYDEAAWQLNNIDMTVTSGAVLGIVGPNGSGKSTLLRLAAGLLESNRGYVRLEGKPLSELSRRHIAQILGYLPQLVPAAYDHTVEEVVAMGRFCRLLGLGFVTDTDQAVIEQCMEQTEVAALRTRPLSRLSGGERQRVMLASVLAQEPRVLLLDEPTTGLDLHHQVNFFRLLSQLAQQEMAIAVVTHDLNLAAQFCDRLMLLNRGYKVAEGSVTEVLTPECLSQVYADDLHVAAHPVNGRPIILPVGGQD